MLHAVLHGKAGRVAIEGEDRSWRELFRNREDLLTATFFGRLRYLSAEGERKVLSLLIGEELAEEFGPIQEIIFWPKLKGLEGRQHVEPDVVLIFEKTLLLIEVKPPFGGDQHEEQWKAQVDSLILQRKIDDAPFEVPDEFHFLALGRNVPGYQQAADRLLNEFRDAGLLSVYTHQWALVCHGVHELADGDAGRDGVVYADWIEAFTLFGMVEKPLPFEDLCRIEIGQRWQEMLMKFDVKEVKTPEGKIQWQPLLELSQRINLEGNPWR